MKIINLFFFFVMVVMNYLANALPINNKTTGALSAQYPNLFVPAGVTFSIWGVIYLMLGIFVVLQFRTQHKALISSIGWAFALSCLLNALWIIVWHYEKLSLSVLVMLGLLAVLVYINLQLRDQPSGLIKAAFGIYLGWICIAAIANITALLVHFNWTGWGISDQSWAMVMIIAGFIITALVVCGLRNPFVGLAVMWAFAGIVINRHASHMAIAHTAVIAAIAMAIVALYAFMKKPG